MTDPILYLSMLLGLGGVYILISSFHDDDDGVLVSMTHLCVLHSVNGLLESPNVNSQLVNDGPEALDVLGVFGHLLLEPCAVTIPGFKLHPFSA